MVINEGDSKINECFFQTTCHHYHQGTASTLSVDIVQTFTYGACQILTIVFYEGLIRFLVMKKRSNTIHTQNVFYYDIESQLEERLECRFQEMTESSDTVTVKKSVTLLPGLVNLHNLKEKLTERELNCMEVAHCKSHFAVCGKFDAIRKETFLRKPM